MSRCFLNTLQRYYFEQAKARKKCIVMLVESVEQPPKASLSPTKGKRKGLTPVPSPNGEGRKRSCLHTKWCIVGV